jgi:hypothetical protein
VNCKTRQYRLHKRQPVFRVVVQLQKWSNAQLNPAMVERPSLFSITIDLND